MSRRSGFVNTFLMKQLLLTRLAIRANLLWWVEVDYKGHQERQNYCLDTPKENEEAMLTRLAIRAN